jgi:hypothetical protein
LKNYFARAKNILEPATKTGKFFKKGVEFMFMYCPRCGGSDLEYVFCGCREKACVYCGQGINCADPFDGEMDKDSLPVNSFLKACKLRRKYNKIPGNKEKGKKRVKENKSFWDEVEENGRKIRKGREELEKFLRKHSKENLEKL